MFVLISDRRRQLFGASATLVPKTCLRTKYLFEMYAAGFVRKAWSACTTNMTTGLSAGAMDLKIYVSKWVICRLVSMAALSSLKLQFKMHIRAIDGMHYSARWYSPVICMGEDEIIDCALAGGSTWNFAKEVLPQACCSPNAAAMLCACSTLRSTYHLFRGQSGFH